MVVLWTQWTVAEGPPIQYMQLGTDCGAELTRQCQVTHDRSVDAAQESNPPVPGTTETHWTVPPP